MTVELNHTIVAAHDPEASALFLSEVLGLPAPRSFGPFMIVDTANGVSLDFIEVDDDYEIMTEHYAFLVSDDEFDQIFGRIRERGIGYWADPGKQHAGEINHHYGGRGVYFEDPNGHYLEIITRPYGSDLP
jgi:catechol 2,3-dioxygenase-like lactoylglutathione lyase family enzyme